MGKNRRHQIATAATGILVDRHCKLVWGHFVGDNVGTGTAKLYNGLSASGELLLSVIHAKTVVVDVHPPDPIEFRNGIYLALANSGTVLLIWEEYSDLEYNAQG